MFLWTIEFPFQVDKTLGPSSQRVCYRVRRLVTCPALELELSTGSRSEARGIWALQLIML